MTTIEALLKKKRDELAMIDADLVKAKSLSNERSVRLTAIKTCLEIYISELEGLVGSEKPPRSKTKIYDIG